MPPLRGSMRVNGLADLGLAPQATQIAPLRGKSYWVTCSNRGVLSGSAEKYLVPWARVFRSAAAKRGLRGVRERSRPVTRRSCGMLRRSRANPLVSPAMLLGSRGASAGLFYMDLQALVGLACSCLNYTTLRMATHQRATQVRTARPAPGPSFLRGFAVVFAPGTWSAAA